MLEKLAKRVRSGLWVVLVALIMALAAAPISADSGPANGGGGGTAQPSNATWE